MWSQATSACSSRAAWNAGRRKKTLAGHVGDIGPHVALGVGARQVGVATVELRAESGHGLGLERVQDQILLGREVVVQATEAEVGGTGGLAHGEAFGAVALDERGDGQEDLVLALEAVLRRTAGVSGHGALFVRTTPAAVAQAPTWREHIGQGERSPGSDNIDTTRAT